MQSGWGSMGAGAWGPAPAPGAQEESPRSPARPPQSFGANTANTERANPIAAPQPASSFGAFQPVNGGSTFQPLSGAPASSSGPTEAELKRREAALIEREKRVAEHEKVLQSQGISLKKNNWPICMPIMFHDIPGEIPEQSRRVVREAYMCWWGLVIALTYQFFCACVMLGEDASQKVPSWLLTIVFWFAGVPLSLWLWYVRIYNAARDDSTFGYIRFFIFFFLHWAWCVFCAIGLQINAAQWSFSGFMAGISAFGFNAFSGTIYMIGGALWSLLALYSMWVMKDAWYFFRGQGGVEEVKKKAASEAALAAFRGSMTNGSRSNANQV